MGIFLQDFFYVNDLQESISFIDGGCRGLNDEECMIRRSLAAHTDYIYTQENDAPWSFLYEFQSLLLWNVHNLNCLLMYFAIDQGFTLCMY